MKDLYSKYTGISGLALHGSVHQGSWGLGNIAGCYLAYEALSQASITREFVALHNEKIRERHIASGDSDYWFFLRETDASGEWGKRLGEAQSPYAGELGFEIAGENSCTGRPILFYLPHWAVVAYGLYGGGSYADLAEDA